MEKLSGLPKYRPTPHPPKMSEQLTADEASARVYKWIRENDNQNELKCEELINKLSGSGCGQCTCAANLSSGYLESLRDRGFEVGPRPFGERGNFVQWIPLFAAGDVVEDV